eukprot:CAMPEP_0170469178 /NCGR_PEP_ID=MMETSP0123-20130129/12099_1 /TAXON_ID=182087 /ORGANISM="Favella ehrenbergii, Strain Fehren 1" /LENGTH=118 /DNA_ID=CAMNT_0010735969 /DNA_START=50 /DNA_END=407 /DNA_ORIENTATION=-
MQPGLSWKRFQRRGDEPTSSDKLFEAIDVILAHLDEEGVVLGARDLAVRVHIHKFEPDGALDLAMSRIDRQCLLQLCFAQDTIVVDIDCVENGIEDLERARFLLLRTDSDPCDELFFH